MDALQLDALIKVINKLVDNQELTFKIECDSSTVVHEHFRRQGVNEVINVLKGIRDGHIKMKDYLHED